MCAHLSAKFIQSIIVKKILTITQRIKKDINRKLVTVCYISKMDLSIKHDLSTFDHSQICTYKTNRRFHRYYIINTIFPQRRRSFSYFLTGKKKKKTKQLPPLSHYLTRIRLTRTRPWDSQIGHDNPIANYPRFN